MLERASLVEQFSTFIELANERFSRWVPDGRLIRSMSAAQNRLGEQSTPATDEQGMAQFWAIYWHRRWQKGNAEPYAALSYGHLAAFVQEACYWAAQKTTQFSSSRYTLADYFQLAIARLDTVLKSFSSERGSRLETYAYVAFKNIIRETLRQQKEIHICSDWALLLRLSQTRLEASLRATGKLEIAPAILAWRCFKAAYDPSVHSTRQLDQTDADIWSVVVREYNQQRRTLSPIPPSGEVPPLHKTLRHCAAATRTYLYPKVASLNAALPGQDGGELQDILASPEEDALLEAMVAHEELAQRRQQQANIDQVLRAALGQLPDEAQKIFTLYYRENQTQQQIAEGLGIKQYTVSRRLSKAREAMLKEIAIWSRDTLHIALTSDLLASINTVLEEWLARHYGAIASEGSLP